VSQKRGVEFLQQLHRLLTDCENSFTGGNSNKLSTKYFYNEVFYGTKRSTYMYRPVYVNMWRRYIDMFFGVILYILSV